MAVEAAAEAAMAEEAAADTVAEAVADTAIEAAAEEAAADTSEEDTKRLLRFFSFFQLPFFVILAKRHFICCDTF
jgi:hypothetical protein